MRDYVILFVYCFFVYAYCDGENETQSLSVLARIKRSASGALHIQTNHFQPIHADVKPESLIEDADKCKGPNFPSHIEPGVVFQVTPPADANYELKSLRKSSPLTSKVDFARSICRLTTLTVLIVSAILEFYPLFQGLYYTVHTFMYLK